MKKYLPTLLPILGFALTTVSPAVQQAIMHFVSTHPTWSALLAVLTPIINHWLPSPAASSPSDSTLAKIGTTSLLCLSLGAIVLLTGCSSLERQAYNVIVGSKAFTQDISAQHPECGTRDVNGIWVSAHNSAGVCVALDKGIAAKDLVIDASEEYCAGTDFITGGACNAPTSKTVKDQLAAKVQAAITGYEQTETDLRSLLK
ncbi:MAG TPA: hypothetical protein VH024_00280 [Candidatus Angelobacter sp.]|nr:hypothetical protein [Candidatus Angelobacter sp.]